MFKLDGLKINQIRQSAAKPRKGEGSETIPKGSRIEHIRNGEGGIINRKTLKEYRIWKAMKARCYAPSNKNMGNYQRLGIIVCDEWKNNFFQFLSDMGKIPSNDHTIDRIDTYGNYEPKNCRWLHKSKQSKNRGSFNKVFIYNGKKMILKDWAKEIGMKYTTLYNRIYREKLSFKIAIIKPSRYSPASYESKKGH